MRPGHNDAVASAESREADLTVYGNIAVRPLQNSTAATSRRRSLLQQDDAAGSASGVALGVYGSNAPTGLIVDSGSDAVCSQYPHLPCPHPALHHLALPSPGPPCTVLRCPARCALHLACHETMFCMLSVS